MPDEVLIKGSQARSGLDRLLASLGAAGSVGPTNLNQLAFSIGIAVLIFAHLSLAQQEAIHIKEKHDELMGRDVELGQRRPAVISYDAPSYQRYERGIIVWRPDLGKAYEVHGLIYEKWSALGGQNGLGWPRSDEETTRDGRQISYFENGFIDWYPGDSEATEHLAAEEPNDTSSRPHQDLRKAPYYAWVHSELYYQGKNSYERRQFGKAFRELITFRDRNRLAAASWPEFWNQLQAAIDDAQAQLRSQQNNSKRAQDSEYDAGADRFGKTAPLRTLPPLPQNRSYPARPSNQE